MAHLKITGRAREDVKRLLKAGLTLFGPLQVRRYAVLLDDAYQSLARDPSLGHTRISPRPGTRVFALKQPGIHASHVIVYVHTPSSNTVTILRVLHERADLRRHVK